MRAITDFLPDPDKDPGDGRIDRGDHGRAADPFDYKRLEELELDHLSDQDAARLRGAIEAAQGWIAQFRAGENRGRSFVLTGGYGIGKTTILHNLRGAAVSKVWVGEEDDPEIVQWEPLGRFLTATQAMGLLDPGRKEWAPGMGSQGRGPLAEIFKGVRAVIIDDLGTEEIPYVRAADFETVRQNRYRELMDFCLGNRKRLIPVLVSSNVPLLVEAGEDWEVNPEILAILGGAAWSRLYDYAAGSMFDLTGLPDYRLANPTAGAILGRN